VTKAVVQAGWDETPHLSEEARQQLINSYPPHERDARTRGVPQLGSGAIYPVPETEIVVEPFEWPHFWKQCYALDVGWNRTAALWAAYDSEHDVAYLVSEHYRAQAEPPIHAQAILARGKWIPGVIDPAARGRSQRDGQDLFGIYTDLGLRLSPADNAVEAGIYEVWTRLSTGRLKVFSTLTNWRAEYRLYRRDEKGRVVKEHDHLMDCCRYLVMTGLDIAAFKPREQRSGPQMKADYRPIEAWDQSRGGGRNVANGPYRPYGAG